MKRQGALALAMALVGAGSGLADPLTPIFSANFELGTAGSWSAGVGTEDIVTVLLPGDVPLVMVRIPAGTFMMGSPLNERSREPSEALHQVTLTQDYYLGRTEVTEEQWVAVTGSPPVYTCGDYGEGPSYPRDCVSWDDIAGPGGFVEQLNAHLSSTGQLGAGSFRLPTEAQWERGARAGTQTRFSHGDVLECADRDYLPGPGCDACAPHDPYMWWCGNSAELAHPVGSKQANGYGLHDVHGNAWEWVQDWFGPYPGGPVTDPVGPGAGLNRAIRGGNWFCTGGYCRSARRGGATPSAVSFSIGFRLASSQ